MPILAHEKKVEGHYRSVCLRYSVLLSRARSQFPCGFMLLLVVQTGDGLAFVLSLRSRRGLLRWAVPVHDSVLHVTSITHRWTALHITRTLDRAGIKAMGDDKWLTLIQNASKSDA
jgi:hypothetical protein